MFSDNNISQKIVTNLWFDNNAEDAVHFYMSIFPKNSRITSIMRNTKANQGPDTGVLLVTFELMGEEYTALNGGPEFKFTEAISLCIKCEDQIEVNHYWDKLLSGGGTPSQCGWLKDRYGLSWQVVPVQLHEMLTNGDAAAAERVMAAMMQMAKLDLKTLKAAYDGA